MMRIIDNEEDLATRLRQMSDLLDRERFAIFSVNTDELEIVAKKKLELTKLLSSVSPELMSTLSRFEGDNVGGVLNDIMELITKNSVKNKVNGSMLTQARNMTEKSIGILLSCTERNSIVLYDEQGRVPESSKQRALGAA